MIAGPSGSLNPPAVRSELGARVASGIVLIALALAATYLGGWPFQLFWLLAGIAILFEWTGMTRVEPPRAEQAVGCLGLAAVSALVFSERLLAGALALGISCLAAAVIGRSGRDRSWSMLGIAYAAVIVVVPPHVRDRPELGIVGILWMFAVVWATDIVAYFTGRALGGPKLWPSISPKKTWSGFMGGLVAGTAAGLAVAAAAMRVDGIPPVSVPLVAGVSALASVLSQLGDLGESAMKRRFNVKDSGKLIPGHGGVMDRLDGFWAAAAMVGLVLVSVDLWK
jgi:phosphatidate cytidylyltransferase